MLDKYSTKWTTFPAQDSFFFFFGAATDQIHVLAYARQVLYQWAKSPVPDPHYLSFHYATWRVILLELFMYSYSFAFLGACVSILKFYKPRTELCSSVLETFQRVRYSSVAALSYLDLFFPSIIPWRGKKPWLKFQYEIKSSYHFSMINAKEIVPGSWT